MLRLRTIKEAYKEIKEADPGTAVTINLISGIVIGGTIQSVWYDNQYFFSMNDLEDYLEIPLRRKDEGFDEDFYEEWQSVEELEFIKLK